MSQEIDQASTKLKSALPLGTLVQLKQVAVVTRDLRRSIDGMLKAGIGPWKTYTFDGNTVKERMYMGRPADYEYKIALAQMPGLTWEIIQPFSGENIYSDYLAQRGEGIHHLLFECEGMSLEEKEAAFKNAGYSCIQSGKWLGRCLFAYYQANSDDGIIIEIVDKGPDWKRPEPDEVYN